nr:reverse transcriptase domain-containing protein [Tanacetum cinerariifolium]
MKLRDFSSWDWGHMHVGCWEGCVERFWYGAGVWGGSLGKKRQYDDQSCSDEDVLEKIVSKPLFEEEIIPMESLRTHDSSLPISSKIDSLLDEFAGELTLLKSISSRINKADCDFEEDIRLIEKLLYDNSSPRPPKEFVSANSEAKIESFSPSPILVKDSNSLIEEIDLFYTPDYPMPPGIEDKDYDSERDILKELLRNNTLSFAEKESVHFDIPPFSLPPAKPSDGQDGDGSVCRVSGEWVLVVLVSGKRKKNVLLVLAGSTMHCTVFQKGRQDGGYYLEKSHFMVKEGIVLGHKISKNGIVVDKAKVDVIAKLPHPTTVKGICSFLGHPGFYRRFIQDFSKIARPMTRLLEKDTLFFFSKECIEAFQTLKKKLTEVPILVSPDWDLPFELVCDASNFAIGAVLGQQKKKHFQSIHYASKTMTDGQAHYTTTEKELLAMVYAFEKFWPYLVLSKIIVYTDHSALKYMFNKQDAKLRLL